jgi:RNA polymerase sigma-70 factor (ECF subfamily)
VSTWLLAITRHKAIAIARRHSSDTLDDDAAQEIEDEADNPETAFQKKQRSSLLAQCLAKLSSPHREIIDLVYYHEKSVHEVADIIHVSPNTVKTRVYYARNHLTKLLDEAGLSCDIMVRA